MMIAAILLVAALATTWYVRENGATSTSSEATSRKKQTERQDRAARERRRNIQRQVEEARRRSRQAAAKQRESRSTSSDAGVATTAPAIIVPEGRTLRSDADRFRSRLVEHGVDTLYHFTDASNLASIRANGGLFSWVACREEEIAIQRHGSDSQSRRADVRRNVANYVHLSITDDHPMCYIAKQKGRIVKPVLLEVDPEVVLWSCTKFSDRNAIDRTAHIGSTFADFERIDLALCKRGWWSTELEKKRKQAEVLVRRHVPLRYIRNL